MIIVDTNVLSELMRPRPATAVVEWMRSEPIDTLFTTAISQAEILVGLATMAAGKKKESLRSEANKLFEEDFTDRIFAFDARAASEFAVLIAARRRIGRPISLFDAQIASIVLATGGQLATRNVSDFVDCGFEIIDPWQFT